MTLILSQASYRFVIQVSDRLITSQGAVLTDPISNKSILYSAPDAVVSMAYTGLAYLDGVPTDQWVAEQITGEPLPPGPSPASPTMLRLGTLPRWLHIGPMLKLIAERLTTVFASRRMGKTARQTGVELLVVGWQWNRRRQARPIVAGISKEHGSSRFDLWRARRHFGRDFHLAGTPEKNLEVPERAYLRAGLSKIRSADDAEAVLVNTIRTVSRRIPYVGTDCMSVLIPPPGLGKVRIRFIPLESWRFAIGSGSPRRAIGTFPATFTPWVIGSGVVQAPAIGLGMGSIRMGRFEVAIEGPKVENVTPKVRGPRLPSFAGGLKRPPEPR